MTLSVIYQFVLLFVILIASPCKLWGQYISRSEPVPYNCPSVCVGGTIVLKIPQVQNLGAGTQVQALLSDASGSFATGTQTINASRYSTNQGNSWQNGGYFFSNNINDLYIEITIPTGTPVGSNYTIKIKASTGYVSNDLFQCSGGNKINITAAYSTLPPIAANTAGVDVWNAHIYTWTPTTSAQLTTTALVNAQDFFNPTNYKGHFLKNSLSFDLNYMANGGRCPGAQPALHDGTSISCANSYVTNYSIRLLRNHNFTPGYYRFEIKGDDGIRLSIDGGNTWLLSSFFEQLYSNSTKNTDATYPLGICMSGNASLVIECFQRPADARFTFTATYLSAINVSSPRDTNVCAGTVVSFTAASPNATSYQWFVSSDGGNTYSPVTNNSTYSGATTSTLTVITSAAMDGHLYRCQISGVCAQTIVTGSATLSVSAGNQITGQPSNYSICEGDHAIFGIGISMLAGTTLQWQVNDGNGFVNITNNATYSGATTDSLRITHATSAMSGYQYRCVVVSNCGVINSQTATLAVGSNASISTQPQNQQVCEGATATFTISASGAMSYQWQLNSGGGFIDVPIGTPYSGQNSPTLIINSVPNSLHNYRFRCQVMSCTGQLTSMEVTLQVVQTGSIIEQPKNDTICVDDPASFTVVANNATTYQWQVNDGSGFVNIVNSPPYNGATTATLQISSVNTSMLGYTYRCLVSGCGATIFTTTVKLISSTSLLINQQPLAQTICEGHTATFTVQATGAVTYQWQENSSGSFVNIANSGSPQLLLSAPAVSMSGTSYRCVLSGCGTSIISNEALLTVRPLVVITKQPTDITLCENESSSFSFAATNSLFTQWQVNSGNGFATVLPGAVLGSGTNTDTLSITNPPATFDGTQFRAMLVGCDTTYTQVVTLRVAAGPKFTSMPQSIFLCGENQRAEFTVNTSPAANSYQWQLSSDGGNNFIDIENSTLYEGATSARLVISPATEANDDWLFRCIISGCGQTQISTSAQIDWCKVSPPFYIPSAFSPNGDGTNDVFEIFVDESQVRFVQIMIFNRWGERVFSSNEIKTKWDGTYRNQPSPAGIYVYVLNLVFSNGESLENQKGSITLIR